MKFERRYNRNVIEFLSKKEVALALYLGILWHGQWPPTLPSSHIRLVQFSPASTSVMECSGRHAKFLRRNWDITTHTKRQSMSGKLSFLFVCTSRERFGNEKEGKGELQTREGGRTINRHKTSANVPPRPKRFRIVQTKCLLTLLSCAFLGASIFPQIRFCHTLAAYVWASKLLPLVAHRCCLYCMYNSAWKLPNHVQTNAVSVTHVGCRGTIHLLSSPNDWTHIAWTVPSTHAYLY